MNWFGRVSSKTEDEKQEEDISDFEEDEILEIIGEEKRAKHIEAMTKFVEYLKTQKKQQAAAASDSSSDSDSNDSDSSSSDEDEGKKKKDSSDDGSSSSG